jgi:hypothetical protein
MSLVRWIWTAWAIFGSTASFLFLAFVIIGLTFFDPADDSGGDPSSIYVDLAILGVIVTSILAGVVTGLKTLWLDDIGLLGIGSFIFLCGTASSIVGGVVLWPIAFVFLIGGLCRTIRIRVVPRLQYSG